MTLDQRGPGAQKTQLKPSIWQLPSFQLSPEGADQKAQVLD